MHADRPNHNMSILADAALAIGAGKSRLAAVELLFKQGCSLESIALILARLTAPSLTQRLSYRLVQRLELEPHPGCFTLTHKVNRWISRN